MRKKIWDKELLECFGLTIFYTVIAAGVTVSTIFGFLYQRESWVMYILGLLSSLLYFLALCFWATFFGTLRRHIKEKNTKIERPVKSYYEALDLPANITINLLDN